MSQTARRIAAALAAPLFLLGCPAPQTADRARLGEGAVLISEVHFDPSVSQGSAEFIELTNVAAQPIDISGWAVTGAGRVVVPPGTTLEPGAVVVLCEDLPSCERITGKKLRSIGTFTGKLRNNRGEVVRVEDAQGRVVDEAEYDPADPVVVLAAGTGKSLHRRAGTARGGTGIWDALPLTPGVSTLAKAGAASP